MWYWFSLKLFKYLTQVSIPKFDYNMDSNKTSNNSNQIDNNKGVKSSNSAGGGRMMGSNIINSNNNIGAMNSKR